MLEPNKESKYEDMLKRPSNDANAIGRRPPAYLNYTKEGLLKVKPAAVVRKESKPTAGTEFTVRSRKKGDNRGKNK